MARVPELDPLRERHGMKMVTVDELIAYRRAPRGWSNGSSQSVLPTVYGEFRAIGYRSLIDDKEHMALIKGEVDGVEDVLVRVHDQCVTGDVFHACAATAASSSRPRWR